MRACCRPIAVSVLLAGALLAGCAGTPPSDPGPVPTAPATPTSTDVVQRFEQVPDLHPSVDGYDAGTVEVEPGDGPVRRVAVRVAETPAERAHGLMEVPELPDGAGMWFVYEQDTTGGFWMKNTRVPLDIAYVGADGRVVSIATAEPCREDPCPTYAPEGAYRHVLEVPAGWFEDVGAGVGDRVRRVGA